MQSESICSTIRVYFQWLFTQMYDIWGRNKDEVQYFFLNYRKNKEKPKYLFLNYRRNEDEAQYFFLNYQRNEDKPKYLFLNYRRNEDEAKYLFLNYRRNEDKRSTRWSKIKLKNVNKKRMATARRLIFWGISQGIHCWPDYTVFFFHHYKSWRLWRRR